jgi:alcohol dehydrogenase class IV
MSCCHHYAFVEGGDKLFSVDIAAIKYGVGALAELGDDARGLGLRRVAVFTDPVVAATAPFREGLASLKERSVEAVVYDRVRIEPTDRSFRDAADFAAADRFDGFVSIGGGSVMDTCKAANLYSTWPAEFGTYVNPPIGEGRPVPGPLKPHIACPTTSGTGSECTGIAVFDDLDRKVKTGIAHRALRPSRAVVDPRFTATLPGPVVAASGFDVLSHALESWTAIPFSRRSAPAEAAARPMSQGANPWSDIGCREALRLTGLYLERAVADAGDDEARHAMMWAATLAGIAFGNSGVHIPHGMSYSVAGLVRDFRPAGYPDDEPMCPHGISVIVNAPASFRFTAPASPQRHLEGARLLGADVRDVDPGESGGLLGAHLEAMMLRTGMPNGVGGIGYGEGDVEALARGAHAQQRLLRNAPMAVQIDDLESLYRSAMSYW